MAGRHIDLPSLPLAWISHRRDAEKALDGWKES